MPHLAARVLEKPDVVLFGEPLSYDIVGETAAKGAFVSGDAHGRDVTKKPCTDLPLLAKRPRTRHPHQSIPHPPG